MQEDKNDNVQEIIASQGKASRSFTGYVIGFVVLTILLVGLYVFTKKDGSGSVANSSLNSTENRQTTTLPESQTQTLGTNDSKTSEASSTGNEIKEITVEGSSFKFTPSTFSVSAGEKVKLTFKNTKGFHDLVFDDLDIKTKQLQEGQSEVLEFTAPDTAGEYTFYCSVGNHRVMGMVGKMVVE